MGILRPVLTAGRPPMTRLTLLSQRDPNVWVLWIGPGHRIATCVEVPEAWLAMYRRRVTNEWRGRGVYRWRTTGERGERGCL